MYTCFKREGERERGRERKREREREREGGREREIPSCLGTLETSVKFGGGGGGGEEVRATRKTRTSQPRESERYGGLVAVRSPGQLKINRAW